MLLLQCRRRLSLLKKDDYYHRQGSSQWIAFQNFFHQNLLSSGLYSKLHTLSRMHISSHDQPRAAQISSGSPLSLRKIVFIVLISINGSVGSSDMAAVFVNVVQNYLFPNSCVRLFYKNIGWCYNHRMCVNSLIFCNAVDNPCFSMPFVYLCEKNRSLNCSG